MRYSKQLTTLFLILSLVVAAWTAQELNWTEEAVASASDKNLDKNDSNRIDELEKREKEILAREETLKEQLKRQEMALQQEAAAILESRRKLNEQVKVIEEKWQKKLQEKETELKKKTDELAQFRSKSMDNLRSVYEKMEPKSAAKVLQEVDRNLASRILMGMKEQKAAEILSKMNTEKAREITELNSGISKKKNSRQVNEVKEDNPIAPIGEENKRKEVTEND